MTTAKLQQRQATLINLITRVGGRQNIQKWMDELLKIDWKLAGTGKNKMETETFTIGQKIVHPTWGEGEVFALMGKLVSAKFPGVGTKLVHDTSKLAVVNTATQVKPAKKEVVATKKPQTKKISNALEKAKNQLLALGVLEKSIMLENDVIQVIGADIQVVGNQTYYWDAKVLFDGNVCINPSQVRNSQMKAYEDYKVLQGSKPCKTFEKWLQPQLANLPSLEVNKIDAPPARITVVEELNFWSLRVTRSERHVQELSAAISHELKGSDYQDKATMVFLKKDVLIPLGGRDFFTTKNKDIKGVTEKNGNIKMFIWEESFAPILEKLQAAAAKSGDSFTVDLCYSK